MKLFGAFLLAVTLPMLGGCIMVTVDPLAGVRTDTYDVWCDPCSVYSCGTPHTYRSYSTERYYSYPTHHHYSTSRPTRNYYQNNVVVNPIPVAPQLVHQYPYTQKKEVRRETASRSRITRSKSRTARSRAKTTRRITQRQTQKRHR